MAGHRVQMVADQLQASSWGLMMAGMCRRRSQPHPLRVLGPWGLELHALHGSVPRHQAPLQGPGCPGPVQAQRG